MQKTRFSQESIAVKNTAIPIDNYDTDSDDEDRRREEEEIKRIIKQAKTKSHKQSMDMSPPVTSPNQPNLPFNTTQTPKNAVLRSFESNKINTFKNFFPGTAGVQKDLKADVDLSDKNVILARLKAQQQKTHDSREENPTLPLNKTETENKNLHALKCKLSETTKSKLPEIHSLPKNQEFQKQSFKNLLELYGKKEPNKTMKLFISDKEYKAGNHNSFDFSVTKREDSILPSKDSVAVTKRDEQSLSYGGPITVTEQTRPPTKINQNNIPSTTDVRTESMPNGEGNKRGKNKHVREKTVIDWIPELIACVMKDAAVSLSKTCPYEVPRFKSIEWGSIVRKMKPVKIQVLILDPIDFNVEVFVEIPITTAEEVRDKVHELIKEVDLSVNEAKYILVKYFDAEGNDKLLFSKFFFFVKNNKSYKNSFKSEKEIVAYYLLVLALLEQRIRSENNPFKEEIVELTKAKAYTILKKTKDIPANIQGWFTTQIQNKIAVEKVYLNLNVGGKADSNFTFDVNEYLFYVVAQLGKTAQAFQFKPNPSTKALAPSEPQTYRNNRVSDAPQVEIDCIAILPPNKARPLPTLGTVVLPPREIVITDTISNLLSRKKLDNRRKASPMFYPPSVSPWGRKDSGPVVGFTPTGFMAIEGKMSSLGHSHVNSHLSSPKNHVQRNDQRRFYVNERMNTTYTELVKQRFGNNKAKVY